MAIVFTVGCQAQTTQVLKTSIPSPPTDVLTSTQDVSILTSTPDSTSTPDPIPASQIASQTARVSSVNHNSTTPSISLEGRFVVFTSSDALLGGENPQCSAPEGQFQNCPNIYFYDSQNETLRLVSMSSGGTAGNGPSGNGRTSISGDGRFVVFTSDSTNLVPTDTNGHTDIFVWDSVTGEIELTSVTSRGDEADNSSGQASISADGRYVVYASLASNLVPNDENNVWDVFLTDRQTGINLRLSSAIEGQAGNGPSFAPAISANGQWIAFWSWSTNLVATATDPCSKGKNISNCGDIYLFDRNTGKLQRIAVGETNGIGGPSLDLSLSGDGRWLTFIDRIYDRDFGQTKQLCTLGQPKLCGGNLSADGEWLVTTSESNTNVYVYNRVAAMPELASIGSDGTPGNGKCCVISVYEGSEFTGGVSISGNGRFVAFASTASNLAADDTQECVDTGRGTYNCYDVFIRDRAVGATKWVSMPFSK